MARCCASRSADCCSATERALHAGERLLLAQQVALTVLHQTRSDVTANGQALEPRQILACDCDLLHLQRDLLLILPDLALQIGKLWPNLRRIGEQLLLGGSSVGGNRCGLSRQRLTCCSPSVLT